MPTLVKKVGAPTLWLNTLYFTADFSWSCPSVLFPILHKVWRSILSMMKHIKTLIIDGSHYHSNSDFLLPIANVTVTVLLLRYTPPAASQTTQCHSYGYCWLWRYKNGCVIVICHVACIVLCRPKHSVDVDAHGEMVWGVRGPSVWTVLLEIRIY